MTREILAAEDAEDLQIVSAKLQDAVAKVADLVWLPKARRFAALFNRFKWEAADKRHADNLRVRSGLSASAIWLIVSRGRAKPSIVSPGFQSFISRRQIPSIQG